MAIIYEQEGEIEQALSLYRQCLDIDESIGNVRGKAITLANMGKLLADYQQDYRTALASLQESLAILTHLRSPDAQTVQGMMNDVLVAALAQQLGTENLDEKLAALDGEQIRALLVEAGVMD